EQYALSAYDAAILTSDRDLATYFEAVVKGSGDAVPAKICANWVISEFLREVNAREWDLANPPLKANQLSELLDLLGKNTISGRIAKTVFDELVEHGGSAAEIVKAKGLVQIVDQSALEAAVDEVLNKSEAQVEEYISGRDKVFGYLVGEVMK